MQASRPSRLFLTLVGAALGLLLSVPELDTSVRHLGSTDVAKALEGGVVLALAVLSLWLLVTSAIVTIALCTGAGIGLARRIAPTWLVTALLSSGGLVLAQSAHAAPADLDGLPLPDRAPAHTEDLPTSASRATADRAGTVVVQAGDCLWNLARAHASPTASTRDIARLTGSWHAANLAVMGPDPDVLIPGQILTIPVDVPVAP